MVRNKKLLVTVFINPLTNQNHHIVDYENYLNYFAHNSWAAKNCKKTLVLYNIFFLFKFLNNI
jgi:hypothetical protein